MTATALVLVLVAAGAHAAWNLTLRAADDRLAAMAVAGLVGGAALLPAAVVLPPWQVLPLIGLSALAEAAYALGLAAAYRKGALAVVYPTARGTAPILVTFGAWFVLGEQPSVVGLLGAAALAVGLSVVGFTGYRSGQVAAVGCALLTGVAIATYQVVDARAVREVAVLGYLGPVLFGQGLILAGLLHRQPARLRRAIAPGAKIAVGSVAAYVLVLFAFQQADAGPVATLREVSVLLGLALAAERPGARLWTGAGLVVGGMVLAAV